MHTYRPVAPPTRMNYVYCYNNVPGGPPVPTAAPTTYEFQPIQLPQDVLSQRIQMLSNELRAKDGELAGVKIRLASSETLHQKTLAELKKYKDKENCDMAAAVAEQRSSTNGPAMAGTDEKQVLEKRLVKKDQQLKKLRRELEDARDKARDLKTLLMKFCAETKQLGENLIKSSEGTVKMYNFLLADDDDFEDFDDFNDGAKEEEPIPAKPTPAPDNNLAVSDPAPNNDLAKPTPAPVNNPAKPAPENNPAVVSDNDAELYESLSNDDEIDMSRVLNTSTPIPTPNPPRAFLEAIAKLTEQQREELENIDLFD